MQYWTLKPHKMMTNICMFLAKNTTEKSKTHIHNAEIFSAKTTVNQVSYPGFYLAKTALPLPVSTV